MAKNVSMEDLADKLGISKNTVSLALRGMPGISNQTRELILKTAREMGYEYKGTLKSSTGALSKNICLVIPKSTYESQGFFSFIQLGIEDEAKRNQFNTILHYYNENEKDFQAPLSVKAGMVSGIITLGRVSSSTICRILELGLPTVMVDHYFDDRSLDYIISDSKSGGYRATMHLIENGHKEIGFIGNIKASISFYDRYEGYLKALQCSGLPVNSSHILADESFEELNFIDPALALKALKSLPKLPTAFFCCNDAEAINLYKALSSAGLSVPGDISVIGFDNIDWAKNISPELTTLHVDKELMGRKAVQRLISLLDTPSEAPEKCIVSVELISRNSVRKV